jgi:hypothetical protein
MIWNFTANVEMPVMYVLYSFVAFHMEKYSIVVKYIFSALHKLS